MLLKGYPDSLVRTVIIKAYHNTCQYCPADEGLEVDHIVPRASGGTDTLDNYTVACTRCNGTLKQGRQLPEPYQGLLIARAKSKSEQILKALQEQLQQRRGIRQPKPKSPTNEPRWKEVEAGNLRISYPTQLNVMALKFYLTLILHPRLAVRKLWGHSLELGGYELEGLLQKCDLTIASLSPCIDFLHTMTIQQSDKRLGRLIIESCLHTDAMAEPMLRLRLYKPEPEWEKTIQLLSA